MAVKKVRLKSTAGTGYFKTTEVNTRAEKKLEKMMYDPVVRKHVLFKEDKIS